MKKLLILKFASFMQSYGVSGRWSHKDTNPYVTKSSVVGLLGSALGYYRDDTALNKLDNSITVHVRVDKAGKLLMDFQTVSSGVYLLQDKGKPAKKKPSKEGAAAILARKYYLSDAVFTVFIEGEEEDIEKYNLALQDPAWPLFLGRKSYPINYDFLLGVVDAPDNMDKFIQSYPIQEVQRVLKVHKNEDVLQFNYYLEDTQGDIMVTDNFDCRGQRFYGYRTLTRKRYTKQVKELKEYVFE